MRERRSPGWGTNRFFAEFDGLVLDRGDCIVVRSPLSPGCCRGNFQRPFGRQGMARTPARRAPEERPAG